MYVIPNAVFSKNIVLNVTRKGREWRLMETISLRVQDVQKVRRRTWAGGLGAGCGRGARRAAGARRGALAGANKDGKVVGFVFKTPSTHQPCSHLPMRAATMRA